MWRMFCNSRVYVVFLYTVVRSHSHSPTSPLKNLTLSLSWCSYDDGVLGGVDPSVRSTVRALYSTEAGGPGGPGKGRASRATNATAKTVRGRVSAYFRRSISNAGDGFSALLKTHKSRRTQRLQSISQTAPIIGEDEAAALDDAEAKAAEEKPVKSKRADDTESSSSSGSGSDSR